MIRRYASLKASAGTRIDPALRLEVMSRDGYMCVGMVVGFPVTTDHRGQLELDHVRASHGMGMKSATEASNLVALCGDCHRWKTAYGREARPMLLEYLESWS